MLDMAQTNTTTERLGDKHLASLIGITRSDADRGDTRAFALLAALTELQERRAAEVQK